MIFKKPVLVLKKIDGLGLVT